MSITLKQIKMESSVEKPSPIVGQSGKLIKSLDTLTENVVWQRKDRMFQG